MQMQQQHGAAPLTFDHLYAQRLQEFKDNEIQVPQLECRASAIRSLLLDDAVAGSAQAHDLRKELAAVTDRIHRIQGKCDEVEYILNAMPFIREYTCSDADGDGMCSARTEALAEEAAPPPPSGMMDMFVTVTHTSQRNSVLHRYLSEVEGIRDSCRKEHDLSKETQWQCTKCKEWSVVLDTQQSSLVCTSCGVCQPYMESTYKSLTYDQQAHYEVKSGFSYKRLNHFSEWLSSLQARENTEIPDEVINALKAELKKERVTQRSQIKPTKIRAFLKKINQQRYYEHVHHICDILSGGNYSAPKLSPQLEERFKTMFLQIQAPFERHQATIPGRKNFLSYSFTLHKFAELLGEDHLLPYFPLLKSSAKLFAQDQIWRLICNDLEWEFIAST